MLTRGFTYTVVDHAGRACYHVPEMRAEIEFELAHLGKAHRLLVDVPDNDGEETPYQVLALTGTNLQLSGHQAIALPLLH